MRRKKIAIIGASSGQLPLVRKARERNIETVCFAWDKDAVCKSECDAFFPLSIYEVDEIVKKCKEIEIDGVLSTASEETALIAAEVASRLGLNTTDPDRIKDIQDKSLVRRLTCQISGLSTPKTWNTNELKDIEYPCVVKPAKGSAKKGVSYCDSFKHLEKCLEYAGTSDSDILIEEYVQGDEYSVESLSFNGKHEVIQITKKISSGYPHFVELEHHQPAPLDEGIKQAAISVVKEILSVCGFTDGASHTEIKINNGLIYLIEVNPRGAGGRIADTLIGLSTNCDYLSSMIDIALGEYKYKKTVNKAFSGILYLTAQNSRILPYFDKGQDYEWLIERKRINKHLTESKSNYDRDGYIIYKSNQQLNL